MSSVKTYCKRKCAAKHVAEAHVLYACARHRQFLPLLVIHRRPEHSAFCEHGTHQRGLHFDGQTPSSTEGLQAHRLCCQQDQTDADGRQVGATQVSAGSRNGEVEQKHLCQRWQAECEAAFDEHREALEGGVFAVCPTEVE
jgi:hypothetical protein